MVHVWFPFITGFLPSGTHLKLSLLVSNTTHLFLYLTCQFSCQAEVNRNLYVFLSLSLAHWRLSVFQQVHIFLAISVSFSVSKAWHSHYPSVYATKVRFSHAQHTHPQCIWKLTNHLCCFKLNLHILLTSRISIAPANPKICNSSNLLRLHLCLLIISLDSFRLQIFIFPFFFFFLEFSVPPEKKFILSTYKKVMYIIGEEGQQVS